MNASLRLRTLTATALLGLVGALGACGGDDSEDDTLEAATPDASWDVSAARLGQAVAARVDSVGSERLTALYPADRPTLFWVADDGLTEDGGRAFRTLATIEAEGLAPERYNVPRLRELAMSEDIDEHVLAELETAMSEGLAVLAGDLARGRLRQANFETGWEIDTEDPALPDSVRSGADLLDHLDAVRPQVEQYERLKGLLAELRRIRADGGFTRVPTEEVFEVGDSAPVIATLRTRLGESLNPEEQELARAGSSRPQVYDESLARAVELFQTRNGIEQDSVMGPATSRELNASIDERISEVEVALERWRWLPADLGSPSIFVNTPGLRLHAMSGGQPDLTMKVIIGQRDWETMLFEDVMETVVINPYWNVPENILQRDILPKLRENPNYLRENNFEVVSRETWEPVPLEAFDPSRYDRFLLREKPGEQNSLGYVKFLFPNDHAIYLHDTPADDLFEERIRTFSHGCIRVQYPTELAHWVFSNGTDVPPSRFDELKATGERHEVPVSKEMPVYIAYQTVWVDDQGVPTFHPDLYDRNARVVAALERLASDGSLGQE